MPAEPSRATTSMASSWGRACTRAPRAASFASPSRPRRPLVMKLPRIGPDQQSESVVGFETEATIVPTLRGPHVRRSWRPGTSRARRISSPRGSKGDPGRAARAGASAPGRCDPDRRRPRGCAPQPAPAGRDPPGPEAVDVILRADGTRGLVDFGFAHHARYPDLLAEETRFGAGSAPYVSPEQLLGTHRIGAAICSRWASSSTRWRRGSSLSASRTRTSATGSGSSAAAGDAGAGHPALDAGDHPPLPGAARRAPVPVGRARGLRPAPPGAGPPHAARDQGRAGRPALARSAVSARAGRARATPPVPRPAPQPDADRVGRRQHQGHRRRAAPRHPLRDLADARAQLRVPADSPSP